MTNETEKALDFLCERNVLSDYLSQEQYFFKLLDFIEYQGGEALQKLAGFYLYCVANIDDAEKQERIVRTTFAHDLGGAKDKLMCPRSDNYLKYWIERDVTVR